MNIYLAPLQGLTDWIFRESFSEHIGLFDKTFSPFIRVQHGEFYRPSQCNDILSTHNVFQTPIPQFLGNDIDSFKRFEELCINQNYTEANINMGCPYPMVTGKRMGAGILTEPEKLSKLFEAIFANTQLKISAKSRLGMNNLEEFEHLIPIFNSYPFEEIIIHPRIGKQQYKGDADRDAFVQNAAKLHHSVCYNGDITNISEIEALKNSFPRLEKIMIGRGILQNPFLLSEIRNEEISQHDKMNMLLKFHESMLNRCKEKYSGDLHFLKRLEEFWEYHHLYFENGRKIYKAIKKSKTLVQYEGVVFKAINDLR